MSSRLPIGDQQEDGVRTAVNCRYLHAATLSQTSRRRSRGQPQRTLGAGEHFPPGEFLHRPSAGSARVRGGDILAQPLHWLARMEAM